jgi:hypothetical protein
MNSGCTGFARERTPVDREAEELYRLFNLSLHLPCIAGTDGNSKRVNPAFEKTLGYTTADNSPASTHVNVSYAPCTLYSETVMGFSPATLRHRTEV